MFIRSRTQGFTLIELLVVIAIIGVLSSVVLASLNTARTRGQDAARMEDVKSLKTAMELYYNDNGHYPQGCVGNPDIGYSISNISSCSGFVPTDISSIPVLLVADNDMYVWDSTYGYGLWINTSAGGCRTGVNVNPYWWGSPATCNF